MAKRTTKRRPTRGTKKAPFPVGGRKGSATAGDRDAKLARIERDLLAAIEEMEQVLRKLRDRLEELQAERTAPEAEGMMAMSGPVMGPTQVTKD